MNGKQVNEFFNFKYHIAYLAKTKDGKEYIDTLILEKVPFNLSKNGNIDKVKSLVSKYADTKLGSRHPEVKILSWNEITN